MAAWSLSSTRWSVEPLLVGFDLAAVEVLDLAGADFESLGELAKLLAADGHVVFQDKPPHALSAGRPTERTGVGPVAVIGGEQAAGVHHGIQVFRGALFGGDVLPEHGDGGVGRAGVLAQADL